MVRVNPLQERSIKLNQAHEQGDHALTGYKKSLKLFRSNGLPYTNLDDN